MRSEKVKIEVKKEARHERRPARVASFMDWNEEGRVHRQNSERKKAKVN